jgi:hypothetical protein
MAWMNINNCNIFWPWSIWECQRQNHHNPTCWCLMVNVCWLRGQTKNIIRVCHTLSDSGMIIRHLMIKIMMLIITNPIIIFIRIRRFFLSSLPLMFHWNGVSIEKPLVCQTQRGTPFNGLWNYMKLWSSFHQKPCSRTNPFRPNISNSWEIRPIDADRSWKII